MSISFADYHQSLKLLDFATRLLELFSVLVVSVDHIVDFELSSYQAVLYTRFWVQ